MEVLFPGSTGIAQQFEIRWLELRPPQPLAIADFEVRGFEAVHASGAPALALRLVRDGSVITYSGDTEWTDALLAASAEADLFVCEAYTFEKAVKYHLSYRSLVDHRASISAKRLILTHLSPDMLARVAEADLEIAYDGLVVAIGERPGPVP
jgi:ribonuclease BN (tRNA processing enzyme)